MTTNEVVHLETMINKKNQIDAKLSSSKQAVVKAEAEVAATEADITALRGKRSNLSPSITAAPVSALALAPAPAPAAEVVLPPEAKLNSGPVVNQAPLSAVDVVPSACVRPTTWGSGETAWNVCLDDVHPNSCVVYSYGLGMAWEFENTADASGCVVHGFDPTGRNWRWTTAAARPCAALRVCV